MLGGFPGLRIETRGTRSRLINKCSERIETRGEMDQAAILDHQFRIAAYVVTWVIQLGYLGWLGMKWRAIKRDRAR